MVEKDVTMRQDAGTGSSGQNSSGGTTGSAGTSGVENPAVGKVVNRLFFHNQTGMKHHL